MTSRVYEKSTHPHRVPIVVTEKSAVADAKLDTRKSVNGHLRTEVGRIYCLHPAYRMPDESKDSIECKNTMKSRGRVWELKDEECVQPFLGC